MGVDDIVTISGSCPTRADSVSAQIILTNMRAMGKSKSVISGDSGMMKKRVTDIIVPSIRKSSRKFNTVGLSG